MKFDKGLIVVDDYGALKQILKLDSNGFINIIDYWLILEMDDGGKEYGNKIENCK